MNDWYFLVLFEILGYLEGALRRDSSSGLRCGGSRLCKQDVDGRMDLMSVGSLPKCCRFTTLSVSVILPSFVTVNL